MENLPLKTTERHHEATLKQRQRRVSGMKANLEHLLSLFLLDFSLFRFLQALGLLAFLTPRLKLLGVPSGLVQFKCSLGKKYDPDEFLHSSYKLRIPDLVAKKGFARFCTSFASFCGGC